MEASLSARRPVQDLWKAKTGHLRSFVRVFEQRNRVDRPSVSTDTASFPFRRFFVFDLYRRREMSGTNCDLWEVDLDLKWAFLGGRPSPLCPWGERRVVVVVDSRHDKGFGCWGLGWLCDCPPLFSEVCEDGLRRLHVPKCALDMHVHW